MLVFPLLKRGLWETGRGERREEMEREGDERKRRPGWREEGTLLRYEAGSRGRKKRHRKDGLRKEKRVKRDIKLGDAEGRKDTDKMVYEEKEKGKANVSERS